MIKMITTVAIVLALASPAFAGAKGKVNVTGTTGTSTFGATQTFGHVHGNAFGAAGSLTGAGATAQVSGGGTVNGSGHKTQGVAYGELNAGSTSVSGAGSLVVGTGSAYNSSAGQSGSSANIGLKVK